MLFKYFGVYFNYNGSFINYKNLAQPKRAFLHFKKSN